MKIRRLQLHIYVFPKQEHHLQTYVIETAIDKNNKLSTYTSLSKTSVRKQRPEQKKLKKKKEI